MSTSVLPFALGGSVIVLVSGLAATQAPIEAAEDLRRAIDDLMETTTRDLNTGWLKPLDVYGATDAGRVHDLRLLGRAGGFAESVDLLQLVVTSGGANLTVLDISAVRDRDGSLARGALNDEDLVAIVFRLADPVGPKDDIELTFVPADAAPLHVLLGVPLTLSQERVRLDVMSVW